MIKRRIEQEIKEIRMDLDLTRKQKDRLQTLQLLLIAYQRNTEHILEEFNLQLLKGGACPQSKQTQSDRLSLFVGITLRSLVSLALSCSTPISSKLRKSSL